MHRQLRAHLGEIIPRCTRVPTRLGYGTYELCIWNDNVQRVQENEAIKSVFGTQGRLN